MKVEGTYTFSAERETVWEMLLDPDVLASVMPGCEKLEKVGENEFTGILKIRIGPVQGKFNGTVKLSDLNAPAGYNLEVNGKGAPGFVKGTGGLHLEAMNGQTVMQYEGDAQVGGRLASVGQRLLDTSARAIIRQSLEGLDQQVQARLQPDSTPTPPPPAPSQTQFAVGVAKNMLEDLVPPEKQGEVITKGIILLGGLFILLQIGGWWANKVADRVARKLMETE